MVPKATSDTPVTKTTSDTTQKSTYELIMPNLDCTETIGDTTQKSTYELIMPNLDCTETIDDCNSPNLVMKNTNFFFHFLFPCLHHSIHIHLPFQTFTWKQIKMGS